MAGVHGNRTRPAGCTLGRSLGAADHQEAVVSANCDGDDLFGIFLILGTLGTVFVAWCFWQDAGGCAAKAEERDQSPAVLYLEVEEIFGGRS